MGCGASVVKVRYSHITDDYKRYEDITKALRGQRILGVEYLKGMTSSQLILGLDFTKSNADKGLRSFGGQSLHHVGPKELNPYQEVLTIIAGQLAEFDSDQLFPCYGFGDTVTGKSYVFSFEPYDEPCDGLQRVLERYEAIAGTVCLSGPTSFAPLIRQSIKIARESTEHTILLIVADGGVSQSEMKSTEDAIAEASLYPLSIVMIGVGDGPWGIMAEYDDWLRKRCFDNFHFVNYNTVFKQYPYATNTRARHEAFACEALMEVPSQYAAAKMLGYFSPDRILPEFLQPPLALGPPDCPNPGDPSHGILADWTAVYDYNQETYFYMNRKTKRRMWGRPIDAHAILHGTLTAKSEK